MLGKSRRLLALSACALGLFGCSSEDEFTADASGTYTVAISNRASSCDFKDWVEGKETSGIELVITQDNRNIHGTLGGVTGAFFTVAFGSAEFDGSIQADRLSMTNYGTRANMTGNCSYTYNATVDGTQTGDAISGTITYATKTNGNPDCSAVECSATQDFSGSRPPR
jgi:hypothetical protein